MRYFITIYYEKKKCGKEIIIMNTYSQTFVSVSFMINKKKKYFILHVQHYYTNFTRFNYSIEETEEKHRKFVSE